MTKTTKTKAKAKAGTDTKTRPDLEPSKPISSAPHHANRALLTKFTLPAVMSASAARPHKDKVERADKPRTRQDCTKTDIKTRKS